MMKQLLILWAGQTGRNLQLARAAAAAASEAGEGEIDVRLLPAQQAGIDDLLACHGLIVATPENFGYMAGTLKDFFDRTFYPAQGRVEGLPYAILICAGNDGSGAQAAIERIARGYPLTPACEPLIVHGEPDQAALERAAEVGATLALGLSLGLF